MAASFKWNFANEKFQILIENLLKIPKGHIDNNQHLFGKWFGAE